MLRKEEHLDSKYLAHHNVVMRTTVTLEKDVERMLREAMRRSGRSFKETLNAAIRAALGGKPSQTEHAPFKVKARPLGLRPGYDPAGFNKLVDDLEAEAYVERHSGSDTS
ncbi:MAG: antitoxin [Candidatus Hydrogenedentes bacterium]|nr:antitoxin [Candidatus Hydrogenedentota bacterium]